MDIDNHMATWKVIALVSGNIEAVSGPAAQDRPRTHEWIVWQGAAADKADALQCAEKADPVRIRHERILITGKILLNPQAPSDSVEGSSGVAY